MILEMHRSKFNYFAKWLCSLWTDFVSMMASQLYKIQSTLQVYSLNSNEGRD